MANKKKFKANLVFEGELDLSRLVSDYFESYLYEDLAADLHNMFVTALKSPALKKLVASRLEEAIETMSVKELLLHTIRSN